MSTLRQRLKQPITYLLAMAALVCMAGLDSLRTPNRQLSSRVYLSLIHQYQRHASPLLSKYIRCRFHPTCSDYSIGAVQAFGIRKGLVLSAQRLWRCRASVPLNTHDPIPFDSTSSRSNPD